MNRKSNPIISIVVATKDRYVYLFKLIEYFRNSISSDDIEFVIQDNTLNNLEIIQFLKINQDQRIKYFHYPKWISMSDNFDKGIYNSTGDYVTLIGDDDGFLPWIVDLCFWLKNENIDAVVTKKPHYIWSDIGANIWLKGTDGQLTYHKHNLNVEEISLLNQRKLVLKNAAVSMEKLPRVYHGIVSRKKMDNLREKCGNFFPGGSPDMANAIALLEFISNPVYLNFPVIITGNGYNSAGGQGIRGKHHGEIKSKTFLPKNASENWESKVPHYWSGGTIYAESAIKAFTSSGRKDLVEKFNYNYLYAHCLVFDRLYLKDIFEKIKKEIQNQPLSLFIILFYFIKIFFVRANTFIKNFIYNKLNLSNSDIKNFETINLASEFLIKEFEHKNKPWG